MDPRNTLKNCGSSSNLHSRSQLPSGVIRPSFPATGCWSAFELTTMLRNLKQLNSLPPFPTLFCTKNTGPGESLFISHAKTGNNQLRTPRITRVETKRSNARFVIFILMENVARAGKVAFQGKQPMPPRPRSSLYGTTFEHFKDDGLLRYFPIPPGH